ncbi:MAG: CoA transferase [Dehalococcoidia bacterium]
MSMPLEGFRILDMTVWQQGPVATAMLADMGAKVIKIEERTKGDPGRQIKINWPWEDDDFPISFYFEGNNRNKKSLALDLKTPGGKKIFYRLVERSDAFVSNFRRAALDRLELDYPTLRQRNAKIIYAVASGYGPKGPYTDRPCNDFAGLALGGLLSQVRDGPPIAFSGGIADQSAAFILAYGVVVALLARERTGLGQEVNTSLLGSQIALGANTLQGYLMTGKFPIDHTATKPLHPFWSVYQTKDKRWLCLAFLEPHRYWHDACDALGFKELEEDPRFDTEKKRSRANSGVLIEMVKEAIAQKTLEEWTAILDQKDFVWAPVRGYDEVASDPQAIANGYIVDFNHPVIGATKLAGIPVQLSETPGKVRSAAPQLGEHSEEVLSQICHYSPEEISRFKAEKVI